MKIVYSIPKMADKIRATGPKEEWVGRHKGIEEGASSLQLNWQGKPFAPQIHSILFRNTKQLALYFLYHEVCQNTSAYVFLIEGYSILPILKESVPKKVEEPLN